MHAITCSLTSIITLITLTYSHTYHNQVPKPASQFWEFARDPLLRKARLPKFPFERASSGFPKFGGIWENPNERPSQRGLEPQAFDSWAPRLNLVTKPFGYLLAGCMAFFLPKVFSYTWPSQIPRNLGKSGKDDFKGREVNKARTELDNQKATIARIKENVHKREPCSARTRALRWFRAHTEYWIIF